MIPPDLNFLGAALSYAQSIAPNVRPFVKLPALASVTEGASPDMTRWIQTLAICRWTKQRKPSKAKGGLPPAASKGQLAAVNLNATIVYVFRRRSFF
jgi:hypothetical protein